MGAGRRRAIKASPNSRFCPRPPSPSRSWRNATSLRSSIFRFSGTSGPPRFRAARRVRALFPRRIWPHSRPGTGFRTRTNIRKRPACPICASRPCVFLKETILAGTPERWNRLRSTLAPAASPGSRLPPHAAKAKTAARARVIFIMGLFIHFPPRRGCSGRRFCCAEAGVTRPKRTPPTRRISASPRKIALDLRGLGKFISDSCISVQRMYSPPAK